jgi:hypothetical protein
MSGFFDHIKNLTNAAREMQNTKREGVRAPGCNVNDGQRAGCKHGLSSGGTKRRRAQYLRAARRKSTITRREARGQSKYA